MLHELVTHALQEHLVVEPGFKPKLVRWLMLFSSTGAFLGIQDLSDGSRGSKGRQFAACPDLTQQEMVSAGAGCRHFLVDGVDVVCLLTKDGQIDDKHRAKHEYFVSLLEEASAEVGVLGPIAASLRDEAVLESARLALAEHKAKPMELGTLAVGDVTGATVIVEQDTWREWWKAKRESMATQRKAKSTKPSRGKNAAPAEGPILMRCLLSGSLIEPQPTHNKIEGLSDVGGLSMGDALTSFDKEAFASFGLEQGANAAMSEAMVKTYVTSLNHLIRNNSRRLAGVKVIYWYSGKVANEDDPMRELFEGFGLRLPEDGEEDSEPAEETADNLSQHQALGRARRLLEAIQSGHRPELVKYRYYALTLSANSGRVVVRDWMEGPFEELLRAISAWFDDLQIQLLDYQELGKPPRYEHVLTCCLRERPPSQSYADWTRPLGPHRAGLWKAAIGGPKTAIPRALIEQAVLAHRASIIANQAILYVNSKERSDGDERKSYNRSLLYARMAVMRAYCNRFARITNKGEYAVDAILDVNHPRTAYHIGRLMAVLEMIQRRAQGEIGATIAQTHYATAATRPIAALPRLQTLVQHHIPKIEPFHLRQQYVTLLTEINLSVGQTIPRTFDLEDQCLFHLGYYHQRAFTPFDESPFRHWTMNGENVRSKSEVIVANLLAHLGIEYVYEQPLEFDDRGTRMNGKDKENGARAIRPDFTVKNTKDGRPIYIEHLGMMDNYSYRVDWNDRLKLYRKLDILPLEESGGQNGVLITTEEKAGTIDCRELVNKLKNLI